MLTSGSHCDVLIGTRARGLRELRRATVARRSQLRRPSIIWLFLRRQDCVDEFKFRVAKFSFAESCHFVIDLIKQVFQTVGSLIAHSLFSFRPMHIETATHYEGRGFSSGNEHTNLLENRVFLNLPVFIENRHNSSLNRPARER
jgi:hypothetical protein